MRVESLFKKPFDFIILKCFIYYMDIGNLI